MLGPKGEFSSLLGRLEYDPSDACSKPSRPFSDSEYSRSQYLSDAKRYLTCMQDAADADRKYANDVIAEGLQESIDDFVSEVRRGY